MNDAAPEQPAAPRSGRSRRHLAACAAVALVVLAIVGGLLGEAAGWPFLIGPLERFVSGRLHREVSFRVADDKLREPPAAALRLFGGLSLQASGSRIAAPDWSDHAHFLLARDASIELSYRALWRLWQGGPLEIDRLSARTLDLHTRRLADGRTSWYFANAAGTQRKRRGPPLIRELRVDEGRVDHADAVRGIDFAARVSTTPGPAGSAAARGARAAGLHATGSGRVHGVPVSASLHVPGVARLSAPSAQSPIPVLFSLRAGQASLDFQGALDDILRRQGIRGAYRSDGHSLSAIGDAFGLSLPTTAAFRMSGHVVSQARRSLVTVDDAVVGRSRLKAALVYERGSSTTLPGLTGQVWGAKLVVADLLPSIGGAAGARSEATGETGAKPSTLPARPFKLQALRAMTANVLLAFDQVELGPALTAPLQSLSAQLTLAQGRLALSALQARLAAGDVRGAASLDGRSDEAQLQLRLRWKGLRAEQWLRPAKADGAPYLSGAADGHAELRGHGRSTAAILAALDGRIVTRLRDAQISRVLLSAAGGDVSRTLAAWMSGDRPVPVSCALADLVVAGGVIRPKTLVVDTPESTLLASGSVSLRSETMDLKVEARPKRLRALSVRTPILVTGALSAPKVSVSLVNPLAALLPFADSADPADDDGTPGCVGR